MNTLTMNIQNTNTVVHEELPSALQFTTDVPDAAIHVVLGSITADDTSTMNQFISKNSGLNNLNEGFITKSKSDVVPTSSGSNLDTIHRMQSEGHQLGGTTLRDVNVRLRHLSDIDIDLWTTPKAALLPNPSLKPTRIHLEKEHPSTSACEDNQPSRMIRLPNLKARQKGKP